MPEFADSTLMGAALIFARIAIASVFLYSGFEKLLNWKGVIEECEAFKLPAPTITAAGTIALHITGGLALVFGIFVTPFAIALAAFTAVATCLAHNFWVHKGIRFVREFTTALEHLGLIGGLLLLAAIYA